MRISNSKEKKRALSRNRGGGRKPSGSRRDASEKVVGGIFQSAAGPTLEGQGEKGGGVAVHCIQGQRHTRTNAEVGPRQRPP